MFLILVCMCVFRMSDRPVVPGRKRSLFAGRASPQPLEVFPGPVRKKVGPVYAPTMLPGRSPPEGQRAAGVGVSGSVPYSASWLHTPVPLRWKPALILHLAVGDGSHLAVPIPWYAVNETMTPQ